MFKTAFVLTVLLAFALQCSTNDSPVADADHTSAPKAQDVSYTTVPSDATAHDTTDTTSALKTTAAAPTTVAPSRSNGVSSKGNCIVFVQISVAIALAAKHAMSL